MMFRKLIPACAAAVLLLLFFEEGAWGQEVSRSQVKGQTYPCVKGVFSFFDYIPACNRIASRGPMMVHRNTRVSYEPLMAIPHVETALPSFSASKDYSFLKYLVDSGLRSDAVNILFASDLYSPSDTLSFLKGYAAYNVLQLDTAALWFSRVSETSPVYPQAVFYNVASLANLGRTSQARTLLKTLRSPERYLELQNLQTAGICLLENDFDGYRNASAAFAHTDLNPYENALEEVYSARVNYRKKSPLAAAALSAVIPGVGKMYAGDVPSGISTLLIVGTSAGFAVESWIKRGGDDWRTILLTTIGGLFYIGNIYGSYVSVSVMDNVITESQDATILFNIHIPLHDLFK